jgi:predicted N-formylglutamate amidohydrolase
VRLLLTCEHASGSVPPEIDLGLSDEARASHISMDRGAAAIAERLAALTGAPLHAGRYSRLVVDLNRRETNPDVIVAESSGVVVPGNVGLGEAAREARIAAYHRPWREAVRADALRLAEDGGVVHLSIHSFTPALDPEARTFDVGVLYVPGRHLEAEIATAIVEGLSARGLDVRHNAPYLGWPEGTTSWLRAQIPPVRYVGLEIEYNQLFLDSEVALATRPERLAAVLRGLGVGA